MFSTIRAEQFQARCSAVGTWPIQRTLSGSGQPPEFLSTHPVDEKRISELQRHMPRALEEYERARPRADKDQNGVTVDGSVSLE